MKLSARFVQYSFFVLFILSVLSGFILVISRDYIVTQAAEFQLENGEPVGTEELLQSISEKTVSFTASIVSMLLSLAGFIVSAVINVRKDRREARETALTLKQKELELQKALLELETLKKQSES